MIQHHFVFSPSFAKIEEFLKLYQKSHESGEDLSILCQVDEAYWTTTISYPDIEKNCWLSLRFAIDEMIRSHKEHKSKVQVLVEKKAASI